MDSNKAVEQETVGTAREQDRLPRPDASPARVLFVCTHNSARSQMAEAILRHLGGDSVAAYSAGSEPGRVHPDAIRTLENLGISTAGLTSKHLGEFAGQDFDYVATVCDSAKETCPVFPGHPTQLHWSFPDPSAITDEAARIQTFHAIASELTERCAGLVAEIAGDAGPVS